MIEKYNREEKKAIWYNYYKITTDNFYQTLNKFQYYKLQFCHDSIITDINNNR